jgi:hypothetical protein
MLGDVFLQEGHGLAPCFFEADRRRSDLVEETALGVHIADEVVHLSKLGVGGADHEIWTFGHQVQLIIGDDGRDLDDDMTTRI